LSDRFFKQVEHLEELYVNGSMTPPRTAQPEPELQLR
jgi:hypothetical protein